MFQTIQVCEIASQDISSDVSIRSDQHNGSIFLNNTFYTDVGDFNLSLTLRNGLNEAFISTTIWVEYLVTGFSSMPHAFHVITGTNVTFNITMVQGSHYTLTLDAGNPVTTTEMFVEVSNNDSFPANIALDRVGLITVTLNATNDVSNDTHSHVITVQDPVLNISLSTLSWERDMLSYSAVVVDFYLDLADGVLPPTNATFHYDFGDSHTHDQPWDPTIRHVVIPHAYNTLGDYEVTVNISNLASYIYMSRVLRIDMPLRDFSIYSNIVETDLPSGVIIEILVNATWGSRLNCTWDWGDGAVTWRRYLNYSEVMEASHQYDLPGTYTPNVTCENSVMVESLHTVSITIQHEIGDYELQCPALVLLSNPAYLTPFRCELLYPLTAPPATDVYLDIDFGDGTKLSAVPLSLVGTNFTATQGLHAYLDHPHGYSKGDDYKVLVTIYNLVTAKNLTALVEVKEEIRALEGINILAGLPDGTTEGPQYSTDHYGMDEGILIQIVRDKGTHMDVTWDFGDGTSNTTYNLLEIWHQYSDPGHYTVSVSLSSQQNPTVESFQKTIRLMRRVQNFTIWVQNPRPQNITFTFLFDFGNIGTDACYYVDFKVRVHPLDS